MHDSVKRMYQDFLAAESQVTQVSTEMNVSAWHFCDNESDADMCAQLVLLGKKQATAPSVWELQDAGMKMPEVGDVHVVTNWAGVAQCMIRTTSVEVLPFKDITPEHAALEGEGDGSLDYWRRVHRAYYQRVLEGSGRSVSDGMPVVFERFEVVYPLIKSVTRALLAPIKAGVSGITSASTADAGRERCGSHQQA